MAEQKSVLIRCKLHRAGGSKIDLFGTEYHFKPESDKPGAPHVCAIPFDDARAVYRLLAIKEAYELVDPSAELPAKPLAPVGQTIGNSPAVPEKKPVVIKDPDGNDITLTDLEPEALRALAKDTFQIKVHHKWSDETVIGKILEAIRGED